MPQDMFAVLKEQGILVEDKNGDHYVETEAALRDLPGAEPEANPEANSEKKSEN